MANFLQFSSYILYSLCFLTTFFVLQSHGFHSWLLTYFTHCFNWMVFKFFHALNYAMHDSLLIASSAQPAVIALLFFTIQRIWIILGRFFKDLFTHFHDFWSQIGVVILVTPKQEEERKSEWFYGVNFLNSNFKVEWENGVWTKIRFLVYDFLFTFGNFTLIFTVFFLIFYGSDFFPNIFPTHS